MRATVLSSKIPPLSHREACLLLASKLTDMIPLESDLFGEENRFIFNEANIFRSKVASLFHAHSSTCFASIIQEASKNTVESEKIPIFSPRTVDVPDIGPVTLRSLRLDDKEDVLQIYRFAEINENNIEDRLNPSSQNNFRNRGGSFKLLNENEFYERLWDPRDVVILASVETPNCPLVIGYYSCGIDTHFHPTVSHNNMSKELVLECPTHIEFLKFLNIDLDSYKPTEPQWQNEFRRKVRYSNKIAGAIDMIVHPEYQGKGLMHLLKHAMFQHLKDEYDTQFAVCTVLTIDSVTRIREKREFNMPNGRSHHVNEKIGRTIGTLPNKGRRIGEAELNLKMDYYLSSVDNALPILEEALHSYNINPS